jgi:NADP-dependent aldehyde dehydrogenase
MPLHGYSLIAGTLTKGGGKTFHATSPLDRKDLDPKFHEATFEDADRALHHAHDAFALFRRAGAVARAALLEKIAEEITALGDDLLHRAHAESGLPVDRLTGERGRTVSQLRLFADLVREGSWCDARIDTALPDRKPVPKPDLRRLLIPLGPVVVFGASNFPLAFSVAGGDTASALAAGCPVVVKAHPAHPGTSELVATAVQRAIEACGLPAGLFSLLHGGAELGLTLVQHPFTRAVGFTGSRTAGIALWRAANERPEPIPVFAEMSSVNPVFILPGALQERGAQIVEGLKASVTMGVGQFCTKPGLVFGLGGVHFESFAEKFGIAIAGAAPATMLHAGICEAYHHGLDRIEKVPGVVALATSDIDPDPAQTQGEPMVFATDAEDFLRHRELHEEVFGPYTLLITANTWTELEAAARSLEGQLTVTLHATTADLASASDLLTILERKAGRLILNGFPTGVEVCPSMQHGGPFPATTDSRFTSVGTAAIQRFVRPVSYQNFPADALPPEVQNENPRGLMRLVNGQLTRDPITQ